MQTKRVPLACSGGGVAWLCSTLTVLLSWGAIKVGAGFYDGERVPGRAAFGHCPQGIELRATVGTNRFGEGVVSVPGKPLDFSVTVETANRDTRAVLVCTDPSVAFNDPPSLECFDETGAVIASVNLEAAALSPVGNVRFAYLGGSDAEDPEAVYSWQETTLPYRKRIVMLEGRPWDWDAEERVGVIPMPKDAARARIRQRVSIQYFVVGETALREADATLTVLWGNWDSGGSAGESKEHSEAQALEE